MGSSAASGVCGRATCPARLQAVNSLLTQTFTNTEWQAEHLPVAVLCRAASWEATLLRIERVPEEACLSMHDFYRKSTKLGSKTPDLLAWRLLCCEADDDEFDYDYFEGENREYKMHPLFLALAHGAPDDVVRAISQPSLFQEGTALVDADENAPLAFAVIHGRPPSTLSLLLSCQPTAVVATDRMGYAPLHHAALARDPDAIRLLLAASTAEAREATEDGALPLHLLARGPAGESQRLTPPVDGSRALAACELLLDAYPAALYEERDISIGVTRGERKWRRSISPPSLTRPRRCCCGCSRRRRTWPLARTAPAASPRTI